MQKIISKSKLIFYAILMFVFNINISNASEYSEWGAIAEPEGIPEQNFRIFMINDVMDFISILLTIVVIIIIYLLIKRNKKLKSITLFFISISIILFILMCLILAIYGQMPPL